MQKLTILMAGPGLALVSSAAMAGAVQPVAVDVELTHRVATGDMVTARYSQNDTEAIGCGIRKFSDGAGGIFEFAFCSAEDRGGERISCNTFDPALIDTVSSSTAFSFVFFGWDEAGACNAIGFSNQSVYLPKKLDGNE